jgi:hypothetical protein
MFPFIFFHMGFFALFWYFLLLTFLFHALMLILLQDPPCAEDSLQPYTQVSIDYTSCGVFIWMLLVR